MEWLGITGKVGLYKHPLVILLLTALLGACATGAQQQAAQMQQASTESISAGRDCLDSVFTKPDYQHLKTKMFLDTTATFAPLQYLSDSTRPNKKDISVVYQIHADIQPCRKIFLTGTANVHPAIVNVLVDSYSATDKLWVEFATGRMT